MNIDEALEKYLVQMNINEGHSIHTISSYHEDLNQYIEYLKKKSIDDTEKVQYADVQAFISEQYKEKRQSSVTRMAASIRSFHQFLAFIYDETDPTLNLEVHTGSFRLPIYCTVDEINRLMSSFSNDKPEDIKNHAILEFIYSCGLRISECTEMTMNRVDLDAGFVRVLGKGNKERIVPIAKGSIPVLKKYRDTVRPLWIKKKTNLFFINRYGRHTTPRSIEIMLKNTCASIGLSSKITPHKLRHSFATHMLQGGADLRSIQKLLGHSNIQTTEIYTHVQNRQLFDSYEKFHPGEKDLTLNDTKTKDKNK